MSKKVSKEKIKELQSINKKEIIEEIEISETLPDRMGRYGMEIATNRALPDVIDGLKPSQRLWLWGMKTVGANKEDTIKSAAISGHVMGEYIPHGDSYETGVRMVDGCEALLSPFIRGQGNFGKHYGSTLTSAASRYTEMVLNDLGKEITNDCSKYHDSNMVPNYNGKSKQPTYLSMPFPNILANAQDGIALGFACSLGSFNLKELCEASIYIIKNFKKENKELIKEVMKIMPTMDFPSGCETYLDNEQIKNIYLNGEGSIPLRSVFEDNKKERILELKELPYSTNIEAITDSVLNAVANGKITEISDIRNETGYDLKIDDTALKVSIDYKTGTDIEELKKKLYALTPCLCNYNANMTVLTEGKPLKKGVIDCIKLWIKHRRNWVEEGLTGRLNEVKDALHLLEGLEKILLDIDKAVKIVRQSKTDSDVISGLKKAFKIDDIQAEFVANIKLRNLNIDWILNKTKEIKNLKATIKELEKKLKDIDQEIINDLERVSKEYGKERKTKIINKWEELPTFAKNTKEKPKLDGKSMLFYGTDAVKRVPEDSGAKAPNGFSKDVVENNGRILIFTNTAKVYSYVIGNIPNNNQTKIKDIKKIAKKMDSGEQVTMITPLDKKKKVLIVFNNGKAVKIPTTSWEITGEQTLKIFKRGICDKASVDFITSIEKDGIIDIHGQKLDTSKVKEVGSKTSNGTRFKWEK